MNAEQHADMLLVHRSVAGAREAIWKARAAAGGSTPDFVRQHGKCALTPSSGAVEIFSNVVF